LTKISNLTNYVLDASILVKWFVDEKYSDYANLVRDNYIDGIIKLHAPELLRYEVMNSLIYSNLFSNEELLIVNESLDNYRILIHKWNKSIADTSTKIAMEINEPIYDSYYLALAIHLGCKFITADSKFYKKFIDKIYFENLLLLRNYK
jgi:predicted nucleic acid-binding protein